MLCTEKGEKVVLVSLDEFNSWKETIYLLSNPANAAHLRQSMAEERAGQLEEKALADA
ncbi:MAG: type II toxin-antitoxin system Phd/YefM family antitoxin [Pyrinomonadaceae bacterium]